MEIILSKPEGLDLEWTNVDALHLHLFFILILFQNEEQYGFK